VKDRGTRAENCRGIKTRRDPVIEENRNLPAGKGRETKKRVAEERSKKGRGRLNE